MQGVGMGGSKTRNLRTGLVLASVALAFFIGIMLKYWLAQ